MTYYRDNVSKGFMPDFNGIMWDFLAKNDLIKGIEPDKKLIESEKLKAQNQFISFGIDDQKKVECYSVMRQFFEKNKDFDFNQFEIL